MPVSRSPTQNHLLAALPAAEFDRLVPELESVSMRLGDALYESGEELTHVYFPTTSIVSLLYAPNVSKCGAAQTIHSTVTTVLAVIQSQLKMMTIIASLAVGVVVGWLASIFMGTDGREGLIRNVTAGVAGAYVGG